MEPCTEQSVFSVTSNSTLTALSFDSASKELSFSVSGDHGTRGYVDVYIPKSLVSDISGLKVYLDGNQIDYTSQSQGDGWLLYFAYHHSAHLVTISLGSPTGPISSSGLNGGKTNGTGLNGILGNYVIYIVTASIAVIIIVLAVALKTWKKSIDITKH